jgi:hypothetical protein
MFYNTSLWSNSGCNRIHKFKTFNVGKVLLLILDFHVFVFSLSAAEVTACATETAKENKATHQIEKELLHEDC